MPGKRVLFLASLQRDMKGKFVTRHGHIPARAEVGSSEHDIGVKARGRLIVRVGTDHVDSDVEHD